MQGIKRAFPNMSSWLGKDAIAWWIQKREKQNRGQRNSHEYSDEECALLLQ